MWDLSSLTRDETPVLSTRDLHYKNGVKLPLREEGPQVFNNLFVHFKIFLQRQCQKISYKENMLLLYTQMCTHLLFKLKSLP